ncbi:MAG: hypothetical protein M3Q85_09510 [Acidobacteriota bacterium]|nr:hypothetical protein [Acidobacteriota bacterium]
MRQYRAGESIEDFCRSCKTDRMHTVVVADAEGQAVRVVCGYCHSEHNFRGGPRVGQESRVASWGSDITAPTREPRRAARAEREPFPIVSERERIAPVSDGSGLDIEMILRRVIREEAGVTATAPAEKWRNGHLVLRPGNPALQEKSWPVETFFHKIVMVRNRLRTLEQQVNAAEIPEDVKVKLQAYVSGCYGSLTSFNILFADEDDQFKGAGG